MKTETAWKRLTAAQREYGSNCLGRSNEFCPAEDMEGHTVVPSSEQAAMLCFRCPLLGKECENYWRALDGRFVGVLNGQVADAWGDQTMDYEGSD